MAARGLKRERVAVAAVAVDEGVDALVEDGGDADGDGFLAAVEVAEAADFLFLGAVGQDAGLGIFLISPLFEAADQEHHSEAVAFELASVGVAVGRRRCGFGPVGSGRVALLYLAGYSHLISSGYISRCARRSAGRRPASSDVRLLSKHSALWALLQCRVLAGLGTNFTSSWGAKLLLSRMQWH
jgi:hypothetical protein